MPFMGIWINIFTDPQYQYFLSYSTTFVDITSGLFLIALQSAVLYINYVE